jgi:predicted TIM-barrel fold metal-dependent hydrolase
MNRKNDRIDLHYHIIPRPYVEALAEKGITGSTYVPFPDWTPQKALSHLDRTGVQTAITSLSSPGVWFGDAAFARRLSRLCNEFQARMTADYPERFGSLAFLPLPDVEGALAEMEYALDELKHDGVVLLTDIEECYLGDPEYEELFAELHRRSAVVFIHPHDDPNQDRRYDLFSPLLEWPIHTTRAVIDLLYTGRLARYSDIRYILAHGGGTIPYLGHRIAAGLGREHPHHLGDLGSDSAFPPRPENGPEQGLEILKGLYYDTAAPGVAHLTALKEFVGAGRVVFGTDGGWTPPVQTAQTIKALLTYKGFGPSQLQQIEKENVLDLFPRLRPARPSLVTQEA